MSAQDPIGSTVPPEGPTNPTHFGGNGLYEPNAATPNAGEGSQSPVWNLAKRYHVPTLLTVGGIVWLLTALVRRSTERW